MDLWSTMINSNISLFWLLISNMLLSIFSLFKHIFNSGEQCYCTFWSNPELVEKKTFQMLFSTRRRNPQQFKRWVKIITSNFLVSPKKKPCFCFLMFCPLHTCVVSLQVQPPAPTSGSACLLHHTAFCHCHFQTFPRKWQTSRNLKCKNDIFSLIPSCNALMWCGLVKVKKNHNSTHGNPCLSTDYSWRLATEKPP